MSTAYTFIATTKQTITIPTGYTFSFTDNSVKQTVTVTINCGPGMPAYVFILWSGSAYTAAGDYTQAAITAAVAAYLAAQPTS